MRNKMSHTRVNSLIGFAPFVLFLSSYMPLWVIMGGRQLLFNVDKLLWGGLHWDALLRFFEYFGVTAICVIACLVGLWGTRTLFHNLDSDMENGITVRIVEISSMKEEPLAYFATYIVPFLFESNFNLINSFTLLLIFIVVYYLYIHSKLMLVNPILSLKYSIYSIKYEDGQITRQGVLIAKDTDIEEYDWAKIYNIGYQLFYGYKRKE